MIKLEELLIQKSVIEAHWVWITSPKQRKGPKSETVQLHVKGQPPIKCGRNDQRVM